METFITITQYFKNFLKAPYGPTYTLFSNFSKVKVFIVALIWSYIINFGFSIIFTLIETLGLINFEDHASTKLFEEYPAYVVAILAVLAAPILEELIFRAPLPLFYKYKKWFPLIFYAIASLFGLLHITNFELTTNVILLSPVLVAPQILIGLFLGVIRIQYGLIYSMLFHAIYNGILILPALSII